MKYLIYTNDGKTVEFTAEKLLEIIFMASTDINREEERKNNLEIISKLADIITIKKLFFTSKLIDLLAIAFNAGFYYHSFLIKNKVEIKEEK